MNPLVGRADVLDAVRALLSPGRVVTLHGPAGVGKSAIARVFESEPGVDVFHVSDALSEESAALTETGAAAELSLAEAVVAAQRAAAAGRCALVASRCRLHLRSEHAVAVAPRAPALGAQLFLRVAGGEALSGAVDGPTADLGASTEVAQAIAEALDGLPFALELAGWRARTLSPEQLLARVREAPLGLTHPLRDVPHRHRSVGAAFLAGWSHLAEPQRAVLRALGAFPRGDVALADLSESLPLPLYELADRVDALVDASWVSLAPSSGSPRLRRGALLTQWLATQVPPEVFAAHDVWVARRADALGARADEGDLVALRALEELRPALLAALARSRSAVPCHEASLIRGLGPLLVAHGPFEVEPFIAAGEPGALYHGSILRIRGQLPEARTVLEGAVRTAAAHGDVRAEGRATAELGIVLHELGALSEAAEHHQRALDLARAVRDRRGVGRALGSLAILHQDQGRPDDAQIHYEEALAVLDDVGDPRSVAIFRINLAELHRESGRFKAAREVLEAVVAHGLEAVGDDRLRAVALGNLGAVQQELGDLEGAVAQRRAAVALLTQLGESRLRGVFLGGLAAARLELGEIGGALGALDEALAQVESAGDRRYAGLFRAYLGVIEAGRGREDAARAAFDAAQSSLEAVGDPALLVALGVHRAHLGRTGEGDRGRAREVLTEVAASACRSDEVRLAVRLLERAIGWSRGEVGPRRVLRIARLGDSFALDDGETVDLSRRKTLKQILSRLASSRLSAPGVPLSVEAVLEAGWPGERVIQEAALNRVYVAVATLRKLGLRDVLASRDSGYYLDDDVQLDYEG